MGNKKGGKDMIQTWLPLPSFKDSIRALSEKDLVTQRLHVLELIEHMHDVEDSQLPDDYERHSQNELDRLHIMWWGHELQLIEYGLEACDEYSSFIGQRDPIYKSISLHLDYARHEDANFGKPVWFGNNEFHLSHQAALLRHDFDHYCREFRVNINRKRVYPVSDLYEHDEED